MQGIESLDNFKKFVSSIGGLGRYEDTYIVHAAEGETVVPMEVFDRNPILKERLFESMRDMGIEPERYIVGNELNSINPVTGQPEFFLKKIFRRIRKGVRDIGSRARKAAADVSGYAAPILGAIYGPAAGAAAGPRSAPLVSLPHATCGQKAPHVWQAAPACRLIIHLQVRRTIPVVVSETASHHESPADWHLRHNLLQAAADTAQAGLRLRTATEAGQ